MKPQTKATILFVDDEEDIIDVITQYFGNKDYRVLSAQNGIEAIKILAKEKVDCCFTDINMPEMDGLELAEKIRKIDNTIPVIIMTGNPSLENSIQTLKNGVVDYLIKPVNLKYMEACVQRVLRERDLFVKNILLTREVEGKRKLERLNRELTHKMDEVNMLNRIMSDFTSIGTSSDVYKKVTDLSCELTRANHARFFVIAENSALFEVAASISNGGLQSGKAKGSALLDDHAVQAGKISSSFEKLILSYLHDQRPLLIANGCENQGLTEKIRSFMMVPLSIRNKIFGVLAVWRTAREHRFSEKDLYYLSFMANKAAYVIENLALYENIYENLFSTLYAFVKAIEAKDPYTKQHSTRVTEISIAISQEMGCSPEEQDILNVAGRLHDIGKIGIRDEILLKPGKLDQKEYEIIKRHPAIGAEIIAQLGLWNREKEIIRSHHERFDGKGYPDGIHGEQIPLLARILSVADVYDAIASDRAYRKKMEESRILKIMYEGAGNQFDPDVIKAFRKLYNNGVIIKISQTSQ